MRKEELIEYMKKNNVDALIIDGHIFFLKEDDLNPLFPEDTKILNKVLPHITDPDIQCRITGSDLEVARVTEHVLHFISYYKYTFKFEVLNSHGPIGTLTYRVDPDEIYRFDVHEGMHLEDLIGVENTIDFMNGRDIKTERFELVHI